MAAWRGARPPPAWRLREAAAPLPTDSSRRPCRRGHLPPRSLQSVPPWCCSYVPAPPVTSRNGSLDSDRTGATWTGARGQRLLTCSVAVLSTRLLGPEVGGQLPQDHLLFTDTISVPWTLGPCPRPSDTRCVCPPPSDTVCVPVPQTLGVCPCPMDTKCVCPHPLDTVCVPVPRTLGLCPHPSDTRSVSPSLGH